MSERLWLRKQTIWTEHAQVSEWHDERLDQVPSPGHGDQEFSCLKNMRSATSFSNTNWQRVIRKLTQEERSLEVCLLDSFIIMKKLKPSNTEFLNYRKEVARQLMARRSFCGKAVRPPTQPLPEVDAKRLDGAYHEIAVTDARKDCVVSSKRVQMRNRDRNYRYKSTIVCITCDGKPLCLNKDRNCWEKWHRQLPYWQ